MNSVAICNFRGGICSTNRVPARGTPTIHGVPRRAAPAKYIVGPTLAVGLLGFDEHLITLAESVVFSPP